jgi:hypothetical protein
VNLVMAPGTGGRTARFGFSSMGTHPVQLTASLWRSRATGRFAEPRMYQLIRQPLPIADRQFEIQFLDPGVEAFVFTFG